MLGLVLVGRIPLGYRRLYNWPVANQGVSRRYFFFGSLLAGAVPAAGFGSKASLKALGYKSPNEKLNIASIGAGGKAASDIDGCARREHRRALRCR